MGGFAPRRLCKPSLQTGILGTDIPAVNYHAAPAAHPLQVSTVLGAAVPAEREQNAWTEGVAIWVAVFVVSLVGAPVWGLGICSTLAAA